MSADLSPAAAALGVVRLVLTGDVDTARQMAGGLTDDERRAVVDCLERSVAELGRVVVRTSLGRSDPVHAATAVAELFDLAAWLQGIPEADIDATVLGRVDELICRTLGLE